MTRVTPLPRDLAKLTRSLGSTVAAPRNSQLLKSRSIAAKLRKELENGIADVPASEVCTTYLHPSPPSRYPDQTFGFRGISVTLSLAPIDSCLSAPGVYQPTRPLSPVCPPSCTPQLLDLYPKLTPLQRTLTTSHRPSHPMPSSTRTIPLMQSFHTTQKPFARADTSTIDFAFLPALDNPSLADNLTAAALRMPLLPDNVETERAPTLFAPEAIDEPLKAPEIVVMAADPSVVNVVSALSEVEGMGPDGIELRFGFGRGGGGAGQEEAGEEFAGGMLKGLWNGLVDDVLGAPKGKVAL